MNYTLKKIKNSEYGQYSVWLYYQYESFIEIMVLKGAHGDTISASQFTGDYMGCKVERVDTTRVHYGLCNKNAAPEDLRNQFLIEVEKEINDGIELAKKLHESERAASAIVKELEDKWVIQKVPAQ